MAIRKNPNHKEIIKNIVLLRNYNTIIASLKYLKKLTNKMIPLLIPIRHLNVRTGEHIGISPLTRKQVTPKNSSVADYLLLCIHSASYDDFKITRENKKFPLELKESLLIMRDNPSLNRNITSAPLYLFDKP